VSDPIEASTTSRTGRRSRMIGQGSDHAAQIQLRCVSGLTGLRALAYARPA
jgi:hypothetical protein